jgi:lactoylglutathione lyase
MDKFANHLSQIGYSFSDGPTKSSSGSVFAFVDAPEGYEVEVIEKQKKQ